MFNYFKFYRKFNIYHVIFKDEIKEEPQTIDNFIEEIKTRLQFQEKNTYLTESDQRELVSYHTNEKLYYLSRYFIIKFIL